MQPWRKTGAQLLGLGAICIFLPAAAQAQSLLASQDVASSAPAQTAEDKSIWENGVGNGFKPGTQSITLDIGSLYGVRLFGGSQSHDLALASVQYGYVFTPAYGVGHWYGGNLEIRGELFAGGQYLPSAESFVGLTPHLRYDFATGTRWVPYLDIGFGASATSIGAPDLSGTFEFNLQAATGVNWFIRNNLAINIEARYMHMSDDSISKPNLGVNTVGLLAGVSWFF